jgi:hypothetical protein
MYSSCQNVDFKNRLLFLEIHADKNLDIFSRNTCMVSEVRHHGVSQFLPLWIFITKIYILIILFLQITFENIYMYRILKI